MIGSKYAFKVQFSIENHCRLCIVCRDIFYEICSVTSLPNDKILDLTKLKAFADDNLNIAKMTVYLLDRVENTLGKGENAVYQHFLFSHSAF